MPMAAAVAAAISELGLDPAAFAADCQKMSVMPPQLAMVEAAAADLLVHMVGKPPPPQEVQAALANTTLVPVGTDPTTRNDGLFKDRCSVLTAANCHEASMAMIRLATGLSVDAVTSLLYESAGLTLDILTHKEAPNGNPPMGQLRKDSQAMVKALIKIVMDRDDKTVVALFMGWLNDLLVQWSFNTEKIAYQASVKPNGTSVLSDHGIAHSAASVASKMHRSRMLPATCASPPFEPTFPTHAWAMTLPRTPPSPSSHCDLLRAAWARPRR